MTGRHLVPLLSLLAIAGLTASEGSLDLAQAVEHGDRDTARMLLRRHVDVNKPEADGTTALHWAVQADDLELITDLVRAGANVKATNRYGVQPITLAATNGSVNAVGALLKAGADPNTVTSGGEPVLMTAARAGNVDTLNLLIGRGANVNAHEKWFGETALMWAAAENHGDAVRALVAAGADKNARSTVLDPPVLEFPRSGGPNSPFPRGGWTPLMFAARQGAIDAARALADLGADLDATALPQTDVTLTPADLTAAAHGVGTTAMVYAIINAHYELATMLLEKGADPSISDIAGMAALYAAVDMNSMQWVQGRPAPILRDRLDAVDLVRFLLEWGADPNAQLKSHPLKRHHDAGTTLNFGQGATPLLRAARTNDVAVMTLLLDYGADPFLMLPDRTDALLIAAGVGYQGLRGEGIRIVVPTEQAAIDAITLLLNQGMDIRAFNAAGNTAIHGAVHRGDSVVRFLAAHGAPVNQKNRAGYTPVDVALGKGGRGNVPDVRESTAALLRTLIQDDKGSTRN